MGINTSVGCAAPSCARYTMIEMGMSVRPEVFSTKNIIMGLVAVSFFLFRSCSCSMARKPKGVAALSRPNILAAMFIKMLPVTGCPFGMSGKRRVNTGDSIFDSTFTTPPRSPIFMMPSQRLSTPVRPSDVSKAVFAVSKVEFIMAGNTVVSPMKTSFTKAMAKAMRKNAIQM